MGSPDSNSLVDSAVKLDESAFKKRGSKENETLNKIRQSRMELQKLKEMTDKVFKLIEDRDRLGLDRFLYEGMTVPVTDLVDHRGYTALHQASFKGFPEIVASLIENASECITEREKLTWVNMKTTDDGFTALHFASFRGNVELIETLLKAGSDINAVNNYGINVMHVAA
mmetsp:Transcript_5068/g.3716  ORF Transcript_5068/g.3716 Transcript_5068/m.3716 type:complete len:170 (-) Transcript_5068:1490-1999(-)|eukprot:CAMPEP_0202960060 /NCGR_PEP_ID=MMETSP1396-20130829/4228_1 /ASSEMBLY_ACC=CAM_ASM_000872 /TAXON_ID= /ORGANISM="Pseudokeronopsis sp., Strain Brazil" /LENGTH=169 /DNA_ID=CAMNT_0049679027 /DNA_START=101 /DNA_END=610 /DNA_ORIENTATION=-